MGEENISIFLAFFVSLLVVVLICSKFLHDRSLLSSILPEAAMVLAIGMVGGFCIHLIAGKRASSSNQEIADDDEVDAEAIDDDLSALLSFSPQVFFIALLPPIIFNSGLRVGALFFRHLAPICMFAVLGTTISAISVAFMLKGLCSLGLCGGFYPTLTELLTFGALISSTDPVSTLAVFSAKRVDPQLFYLVFGESVLNDALGIVLFEAFAKFIRQDNDFSSILTGLAEFFLDLFLDSFGSLALGMVCGLATAFLFKQIDFRKMRLVEMSLYLLMVYVPFLIAEILHLSGIISLLAVGVTANRYVVPNLSPLTKINADILFRLLAHLAETSIFLELGLSVFGLVGHWNWAFIGWSLMACLVGRALHVYPLSFLFNSLLLRQFPGDYDIDDETTEDSSSANYGNGNSNRNNNDLSERFNVNTTVQDLPDDGMVIRRSESNMTASSEMTATPIKRKDLKIRRKTQHMLWFSGLRGAVAYACVRTFPNTFGHLKTFTTTTMAIVLVTVYILGGTTELALKRLRIKSGVDEEKYMEQTLREPIVSSAISHFGMSKQLCFTFTASAIHISFASNTPLLCQCTLLLFVMKSTHTFSRLSFETLRLWRAFRMPRRWKCLPTPREDGRSLRLFLPSR